MLSLIDDNHLCEDTNHANALLEHVCGRPMWFLQTSWCLQVPCWWPLF